MDELCINNIRVLAADTVQGANSGHPGAPMGCAPMAHVLFGETMNFDPSDDAWPNRDRFVLSNGHACALQYTMLHLCGYSLSVDDLKNFRQLDSKTPGHPECHMTSGVEVSTGPLGQGISNAVGMAMARAHMAARFNRPGFPIFDHQVFAICGDGCLQEGVAAEACSLAGHLKLGSLTVLYDDNEIQIDGSTDLAFTEDVLKRFESYGWHTITVTRGDVDTGALRKALAEARGVTDKPTLIKIRTTIGYGSSKQGTHAVHGAALGDDDIAGVKKKFGMDPSKRYFVDPRVKAHYEAAAKAGAAKRAQWARTVEAYGQKYPAEAKELARRLAGKLPENLIDSLPAFKAGDKNATRSYSGKVLEVLAKSMPEILCGSADLSPSNKTNNPGWGGDFQASSPNGRYLRFGVREHAMAAICNGLHAYGGILPACATFLTFTGYALGGMRVSALSGHQVFYVMTHDSIGVGEDGPTHQPIEHLATLRATPNMLVMRPCDGNETSGAYAVALSKRHSPTTFALSRQKVVTLAGSSAAKVAKGGYVIDDCEQRPQLVIVGTGTEVGLCVEAKKALSGVHVRVVSMPCIEIFAEQPLAYQRTVFPSGVPVLSVEAGSTFGWGRYAHAQVGIDTFGKSAPGGDVLRHFGFTPSNVALKAQKLLKFYESRAVPELLERPF